MRPVWKVVTIVSMWALKYMLRKYCSSLLMTKERVGWDGISFWTLARSREQPRAQNCWTRTALGAHSLKFRPMLCRNQFWMVARSREQPRA